LKYKQFTLIELLTVVTVISLLAALLLPALNVARNKARTIHCISNLHSIGTGMRMYLDDANDVMPVVAQLPSAHLTSAPSIVEVLNPYLDNVKVFRCPADMSGYYESEGSSYEYNARMGGRRVEDSFLFRAVGFEDVYIMYDYKPFHGNPGSPGATNFLFADGHVGNMN